MDAHRYADYSLTVAQHPSETNERVMVRVLAWAMVAQDGLAFGRGLSTDEDPDLQVMDLTGAMQLAVLTGLPEEKLVRQFCGRARQVNIFAFGGARLEVWWRRTRAGLNKLDNLTVWTLPTAQTEELAGLLDRTVRLSVSIQDGEFLFSSDKGAVTVRPELSKSASRG